MTKKWNGSGFHPVMRLLLLGLICHLGCRPACASQRPNILFVLTDDQGWATLGCQGNRRAPTPHLDRLAAQGVRFTDAYVMPQCTPTRAALLTGQHSARTRMWHVIGWYGYPWARLAEPPFVESLPAESFTIGKGLKSAGYATACIGKWHLTDERHGSYTALKQQSAPLFGFDAAPAPPSPRYHQQGDKGVDWLTDQALEFIAAHRAQPWFVYLAHHTIHGPVVAPAETVAKYRAAGAPDAGLYNAAYLAAIETLDHGIGKLMLGLEKLGESEETLVVFLSDNGGVYQVHDPKAEASAPGEFPKPRVEREEFSNAPLRAGKGSHYEGGIRVPCIVRWPGVAKPGLVERTPIHVVDWLPTLLDAAAAAAPAACPQDGLSLVPLLKGRPLPERALFWYLPFYELRWGATPAAIIRDGDWKLIHFFGDYFDGGGRYHQGERFELYHLSADLGETKDVSEREPQRVELLRAKLHAWMRSLGAKAPGANPHHETALQLRETRQKQSWNE